MQEKLQNISPLKQRILQYIECLGISKRQFYEITGISRGTLESATGITESILAKFIAYYPEVSLEWLINGKGEMKNQSISTEVVNNKGVGDYDKLIEVVSSLSSSNKDLVAANLELVKMNSNLLKQLDGGAVSHNVRHADVG